jgi:hypothetical protein
LYAPTADAKLYPETYVYCNGNVNSGTWTNPTYAYNNNTGNGATKAFAGVGWCGYLVLNLTYPTNGTKIQYWVGRSNTAITTMQIDVSNQTGSWLNIFSATPTYSAYANCTFASSQYTAMRYRFYNTGTTSRTATIFETQAVNASYTSPYPYTVASSVTTSISLSAVITVNYKTITTLSDSTTATLGKATNFKLSTNTTCSITLGTSIVVVYHGGLTETGTVTLSSDIRVNYHVGTSATDSIGLNLYAVNSSVVASHEIADLNFTGSIGLDTSVQVNYHVGLAGTDSISLDANLLTVYNPSLNETGTISLTTDIQVNYHVPFSMIDSIEAVLNIEGQQAISTNMTGTLTLDTYVQVEYHHVFSEANTIDLNITNPSSFGVPENETGAITFDTSILVNYHVESSEVPFLTVDVNIHQEQFFSVPVNTTGALLLDAQIQVTYHLATTATETLSLTNSKATSFSTMLSLEPKTTSTMPRSYVPPPSGVNPHPTPDPSATAYVFDIRIANLTFIYGFDQFILTRTILVSMNITNAGIISNDAIINWRIDDVTTGISIFESSETVFMTSRASEIVSCSFPLEQGDYIFHCEVASIGGMPLESPAVASLAFSLENIYIDFVKDYYALIFVGMTVFSGICAIYWRSKHKSSSKRRRRKRK